MTIVIFLLFGLPAWAANSCVSSVPSGPAYDFIRVILGENTGVYEMGEQLEDACAQLNLSANSILESARTSAKTVNELNHGRTNLEVQMNENMKATFTRLGGTMTERKYQDELNKLKSIADPMLRVKAVYALVQKYKGPAEDLAQRKKEYMDVELKNHDIYPNPSKTLQRVQRIGSGGVCRDFASLLTWSLNQVSSGPNGKKQFVPEMLAIPNHAVVTVQMPAAGTSKWDWGRKFSLDPTNYPTFNPLPVPDLFASKSEMDSRLRKCHEVLQCLSLQDPRAHPEALSNSTR